MPVLQTPTVPARDMRNFDAFVIDLDGTLLDSRKRISPYSLDVLQRHLSAGLVVILASARPPRALRQMLAPELISQVWKICYNGALVLTPGTNLFITSQSRVDCVSRYTAVF